MMLRNGFLTLALCVVISGAAQAQTQSFIASFNEATLPPDLSTFVTLPKFDTALGTLNGVSLTLDVTFTGTVNIINSRSTAGTVNAARSGVPVTATGPGATTINLTSVSNLASPQIPANVPGFTTLSRTGQTVNDSATVAVNPINFSQFAGGGTYDVNIATGNVAAQGSGSAGLFYGGGGRISGSVTVRYNYTTTSQPIPEPTTMSLLALGVVGCVARRRRAN